MKRREFITFVGGAVASPVLLASRAARSQQPERMRRIGVLMNVTEEGQEGRARLSGFLNGLQQLGWRDGHNVQIDRRWGAGDAERNRKYAAELVALDPDVILAGGDHSVMALQQATRTIPIVFTMNADPVGAGFVDSLARPGGNITGFTLSEYSMAAKWLELLKEIAPGVRRAAVIREAGTAAGTGQFAAIQAVAPALGVELSPIGVREAGEIERGLAAFARSGADRSGLIVTGSGPAALHRDLIIALAARQKLPAVYVLGFFVIAGGLMSYGPDVIDQHRRAADYVDRILKGDKPADLPVQAPTRYELVINLKTSKALGLDMPATVLARADEVIE